MTTYPHLDGIENLDRLTCLQLLRSVPVGRVAWVALDGLVQVRPVNFAVHLDDIVLRCRPGRLLAAVRQGFRLVFEADQIEPALRVGWSVLVRGTAREIEAGLDSERYLPLVEPWAGGDRPCVVRLHPEEITGRRLRPRAGQVSKIESDA